MTRLLDLKAEEKTQARHAALVRAVEFELIGTLSAAGAALDGFSVKYRGYDVLLVLRAHVDECQQVSFVSSDTLMGCILKAISMARNDGLKWDTDKYAR